MDQTPKQKLQKDAPFGHSAVHIPVLVKEVLKYLDPKPGERYLDLTGGFGGHAEAVIALTKHARQAVLVDRDETAVSALRTLFDKTGLTVMRSDFLSASQGLVDEDKQFDLILADLGVSSWHLNQNLRGFSLKETGPLDMRMDERQTATAQEIVNQASEHELVDILRRYGEEPKATAIARRIIARRPITTTTELASIVASVWPGHSRVHPATRTFQALRIAVNDEIGQLERSLPLWIDLLAPGGRIVVISFHSLEDRLVKQAFSERGGTGLDAELKILTPKPITASRNEVVSNPRARSAKLRAAAKINTTERG